MSKKRLTIHNARRPKWLIYIPEEGHWPIWYWGDDKAVARRTYLKWAGRKRLPAGASIGRDTGGMIDHS